MSGHAGGKLAILPETRSHQASAKHVGCAAHVRVLMRGMPCSGHRARAVVARTKLAGLVLFVCTLNIHLQCRRMSGPLQGLGRGSLVVSLSRRQRGQPLAHAVTAHLYHFVWCDVNSEPVLVFDLQSVCAQVVCRHVQERLARVAVG